MANAYFEIDEYLWFSEAIQGNVNVAGLVFDDLIEETLDLGPEEVLTVYSDVLEDTIGLEEGDFKGIHWPTVGDSLAFSEFFGTPLRVRQTVLNVVMTNPLVPALIAHVHMDILHGVDIYWEEVSSELQCHSAYANAVPYYWEWIIESLEIDMTEPQPLPPITLALYLLQNDLVNMRHEVIQEYFFNSKCFEEFFAWDHVVRGWYHRVESLLDNAESVQEIIGKIADEYILLGDLPEPLVKVLHLVEDQVFAFDASNVERYYLCLADETIEITDGQVSFVAINTVGIVDETIGIGETLSPQTVSIGLATESLAFADISTFVHDLIIQEGFEIGDVELARWVFNVLIQSGCNVSDIIG